MKETSHNACPSDVEECPRIAIPWARKALHVAGNVPQMLHHIKGLIVDFDGTLFDHVHLPFRLVSACLPDIFRVKKERQVRRRFAGRDCGTAEAYYREFFGELGAACGRDSESMRHWYFHHYMPRMIRVLRKYYSLRPGVKEFFAQMESSRGSSTGLPADFPKVAVYSDYPFLRERFEALGLVFGPRALLYGPESFGAQKPAPRPFHSIAKDLGVRPEEVLVIGDREDTDGQGAFHAGMRFFCLETGRRRYNRLDPCRLPPGNEQPRGPSIPMYSGTWDDLKQVFARCFSIA
jgi:FMN phosphatase YigB (HAD superfamily)